MIREEHPDGTEIIRQGDVGDKFYIIRKGMVNVTLTDGTVVHDLATRTEGAFFGEAALITGNPRGATVQAMGDVTLYSLGKDDFQVALDANASLKEQIVQIFFQRQ